MKAKRPVYLDITGYKYPNTAIVSILHRISGVILFLSIPFLLWALDKSLASGDQFQALIQQFEVPAIKCLLWIFLAALIFHLVAGIRHLLMDAGLGESLRAGRLSATVVFVVSVLLILLAGFWLW